MFDSTEPTASFALLDAIAAALREEFAVGVAIEEQPGFQNPAEAGQVNRAYRVVARTVLRAGDAPAADLPALLSGLLTRLVTQRLERGGIDERAVKVLLDLERDRDDWLIFLLLTPWPEIERLLANNELDGGAHDAAPPPA